MAKPQVDAEATPNVTEALQAELTFLAFVRRFSIRHCHKALLVSIVAVALWCPSVAGGALLLAAGHAVASNSGPPTWPGANAAGRLRPALCGGMCTVGAWLCAGWGLLQYAVCNAAVQQVLGTDEPGVAVALRVLGIPAIAVRSRLRFPSSPPSARATAAAATCAAM